jgi:hypothetical protein
MASKAIPVLMCGNREVIGRGIIDGLTPECDGMVSPLSPSSLDISSLLGVGGNK